MGRYLWAVRGSGRPDRAYSPYVELPRVGETVIYGDRVRVLWQVQGWNVYLEPPLEPKLLTELVRLTQVVDAPATGP